MSHRLIATAAALALTLGAGAAAAQSTNAGANANPLAHVLELLSGLATPDTTVTTTGQPNASCESFTNRPGASADAGGSAFNPDGVAGKHYAGELTQNQVNDHTVSQYDVACTHIPSNQ